MNNNFSEHLAINKVEELILRAKGQIESRIEKGTTSVSFDGTIYYYDKKPYSKMNLKIIDVQVKGRKKFGKTKSLEEIMVDKKDATVYRDKGGCLYFEVLFRDNNYSEFDIYVATLTPLKLNNKLKTAKGKNILCQFYLVSDENELITIINDYMFNKSLQSSKDGQNNITLTSNDKIAFNNIYNKNENVFSIIGKEKELYVQRNEENSTIPFMVVKILQLSFNRRLTIYVNNFEYAFDCNFSKGEEDILCIGKSLSLNYTSKKLNIKILGTLSERIKDLELITNIIKEKSFKINNIVYSVNCEQNNLNFYNINLNYYKDIEKILNILNVRKEINVNDWTEKDYKNMKAIIEGLLYNRYVIASDLQYSLRLDVITVGNIAIAIKAIKEIDRFKIFNLYDNAFNYTDKYKLSFIDSSLELNTDNQFLMLNKAHFLVDNFNADAIKESLKTLSNEEKELANLISLELIKSYDLSQNEQFINLANYINENYVDDDIIKLLNKLQIQKRKSVISDKDKIRLIEIRDASKDLIIKWAANVLLGNVEESNIYFNQITEDEKKIIMDYPIYYLFRKCN